MLQAPPLAPAAPSDEFARHAWQMPAAQADVLEQMLRCHTAAAQIASFVGQFLRSLGG